MLLGFILCLLARPGQCADITAALESDLELRLLHGRLEALATNSDLIFKGEALATMRITNRAFTVAFKVSATEFRVVSVLKGTLHTNRVTLWHYSGEPDNGPGWSGPSPPVCYHFNPGSAYVVMSAKLDREDIYYTPAAGAIFPANVYRQIADFPIGGEDGILRTRDRQPLNVTDIKAAYSLELGRLLKDGNPTNRIYAIEQMQYMGLLGNRQKN